MFSEMLREKREVVSEDTRGKLRERNKGTFRL